MYKVNNVVKKINEKTILSEMNYTIEFGDKIAIVSNSIRKYDMLLKVLTDVYLITKGTITVEDIPLKEYDKTSMFFIPQKPNHPNFVNIEGFIKNYLIYYKDANDQVINEVLEESGIYKDSMLRMLSFSEIKYVHLVFAVNSGVKYIFIENLFDKITDDFKEKMKELIRNSDKAIISTSEYIEDVSDVMDQFIFIKETSSVIRGTLADYDELFLKYIVVANDFDFNKIKSKAIYVQSNGSTNTILLRKEDIKIIENINKSNPAYIEQVKLRISDLKHIGEEL